MAAKASTYKEPRVTIYIPKSEVNEGGVTVDQTEHVTINGKTPGADSKAVVSYLPDRFCLPSDWTIEELMRFYIDFYEDFDPQRAGQMLEVLQIDKSSRIKTLSKGTQEKLQLSMVMSRRAQLYVLDEPIAGVDPAARDFILKTIITNYDKEASILLSTHLISDVETILDDVIFIKEGKILLESSAEELRERQGKSLDAYFREVFAC